jgi:oligopeptide transport system permease protein
VSAVLAAPVTPWLRVWREARSRFWLLVLLAIAVLCVFGPYWLAIDPEFTDWARLDVAPSWSNGHWLGTDAIGRDVLARVLAGGRLSLLIGALAAVVALFVGLFYGAVAGYAGGGLERAMVRVLDLLAAIPFLLIVVLLLSLFGRSLTLLLLAIAGYVWMDLARVARAEAARLRELPYVLAAQAMGATHPFIVMRHIVPQLLPLAFVYLGLLVPQAILVESFLAFLGLSVDEPAVSWGGLLYEGVQELLDAPWVLLAPALTLVLTLLAFTRLGDALRDLSDPRARRR